MKVERNWLFTEAYPRLKHYCAGLGLDFSMLDMRWGVTEDATNEHITEILCIKEVRNCQRNSIGPNFVVSECCCMSMPHMSVTHDTLLAHLKLCVSM